MKKTRILLTVAAGCTLALSACSGKKTDQQSGKVPAIDLSDMDTTVNPRDDFFRYANGGWMAKNPLKPEDSRYGAFDVLRDSTAARLRRIVEGYSGKEQKPGTNEYRIATLFKLAMDSTKLNADASEPIRGELREIEAIADKRELAKYAGNQDNGGGNTFFGSGVSADMKNSRMNIMHIGQIGLAMGDKSYYLDQDESTKAYREAYVNYFRQLAKLSGYDEAAAARIAGNMLKVETDLAKISLSSVELRDPIANYNMMLVDNFVATHPAFDWKTYLGERNLSNLKEWDVMQPSFFDKFDKWFASTPIEEIKDYLLAATMDGAAPFLSDEFSVARFNFYGKTLSGATEQRARWKRAISTIEETMGELLGQVYVKEYFPEEAKKKMLGLVENLRQALSKRINGLEWMTEATKAKAQEKLNNFSVKIGYPDKWRNYDKLDIKEDSYYANLKRAMKFEHEYEMAQLGKEVDRTRWLMTPQTVNAYYEPSSNEICFPAAILQPPFFNMDADDPVNYGAIGVVIGHEMTHGFDDQGRLFDKDGNMVDWWTEADSKRFEEATAKLISQFDQLIVADDVHADGALTLGENIADQGGLLISYMAMQEAIKGKKVELIDGLTPDQRFFIGYARVWGQNVRKETALRLTKIDVHSLGENRVNQTLRNIDAFFKAFDVQPGNKMYLAPEERVLVW